MEIKAENLICPACGSPDISSDAQSSQLSFPYAGNFEVKEVVDHCNRCGTEGDFSGKNEAAIEAVEQAAKVATANNILNHMNDLGYSTAYLERTLDLPQRTMSRWKSGECSASSMAVLRFVRTYPWLLKVAESKYDPLVSAKTLCNEAFNVIGSFMKASSPGVELNLTVKYGSDAISDKRSSDTSAVAYSLNRAFFIGGGKSENF